MIRSSKRRLQSNGKIKNRHPHAKDTLKTWFADDGP